MLTAADHAIRQTGIGASEVAALLELDPYKTGIDVWLRKATPRRGPIVAPGETSPAAEIGHALEPAIRALYIQRTGNDVAPTPTRRHPDWPMVLATADGLGAPHRPGLEVKIVGANMTHHWGEAGDPEGLPDYVLCQVAQNMSVFDRAAWDVAALVGGTDLRFWHVERDPDLEVSILEADVSFWETYVVHDEPPPPPDKGKLREYMRKRYPGSSATKCRQVGDAVGVADLVEQLVTAKAAKASAEAFYEEIEAALCALVGDDYGIEGPWGRYLWYPVRGRPDWKAIATELAGGEDKIPAAVIDRHRGEGYRVPRLYPAKEKGARSSRGRSR